MTRTYSFYHRWRAWSPCLILLLAGCDGQSHFPVTGTITLGDAPLAGATISFVPVGEGGTPAIGRTGEDGAYTVEVSSDLGGLEPGTYRVRITTYDEGNADADPPMPRIPERVPVKYNLDSSLTADVKPEHNTFDFSLESKARIIQP